MSASSILQKGALDILKMPGKLRVAVPVLMRKPKQPSNDVEAEIAQQILCVFILPPFPTSAMQGAPFVFHDGAEIRVRIIEQPKLNTFEADAYELAEDVELALHWTNPGGILAHPLELAQRPQEMVEDPETRIIDVIFNAVYEVNPQSPSNLGG